MPKVPKQFFIVPDKQIKTASTETNGNYPYQGGSFIGAGVADGSNNGDLQVFGVGRPTSLFEKKFVVTDGGSIGSADYIWTDQSETTNNYYRGEPDRRNMRDVHTPFGNDLKGYGATAFIAPKVNREVLIVSSMDQRDTLVLRYRDLNTDHAKYGGSSASSSWTETTLNLKTLFDQGVDQAGYAANPLVGVDATTLEDGEVLIVVRYQIDIDVYSTEDGINWTLKTKQMVSRFLTNDPYPNTEDLPRTYGRMGGLYSVKIASSNEFIRVSYVGEDIQQGSWYLKILGSTDKGSTWELIQDDILVEAGCVSGQDRFDFYDLIGLKNGQFMLMKVSQYYCSYRGYLAQGTSPFMYQAGLDLDWSFLNSGNSAPRIYLGQDSDWVYAYITADVMPRTYSFGGTNQRNPNNGGSPIGVQWENTFFYIPLDQTVIGGSTQWNNLGIRKTTDGQGLPDVETQGVTGARGVMRYTTCRGKMYNRQDSLAFFAGLFDIATTASDGQVQPIYMRFGGWDYRPIDASITRRSRQTTDQIIDTRENPIQAKLQRGKLWNLIEWCSCWGAPAGVLYASQYSPWTESRNGATRNWTPDRLRITQYNASDYLYYEFRDPSNMDRTGNFLDTPRFNFAFGGNSQISAYLWDGDQDNMGTLNGGCITFKLKMISGGRTNLGDHLVPTMNRPISAGVAINTYIKSNIGSASADQTLWVFFQFASDGTMQVIDKNGQSVMTTNLPVATYGGKFVEWRIAFRPKYNSQGAETSQQGQQVQMIIAQRTEGTKEWLNSDILEPSTNPISSMNSVTQSQRISFGVYQTSGLPAYIAQCEWKDFKVHTGSDLGTFNNATNSTTLPTSVRGRTCSARQTLIEDRVKVVWGGAGASDGDFYLMGTDYTNAFTNAIRFDSPRIRWSSGSSMFTNNGTITAGEENKAGFFHNSFAVFGTNAKTVRVISGNGTPFVTSDTRILDLKRSTGRVIATSGSGLKIQWDAPAPVQGVYSSNGESRKYFAHFSNVPAGSGVEDPTSYLVSRHYKDVNGDQWLQCVGVTMNFSNSSGSIVGTTIEIYSDRGWMTYPAQYGDQKIRIVLGGSTWNAYEKSNPNQELYLGSILVGTTLTLSPVEMNWNYTDQETSNNSMNKTRTGTTWGYNEGPSVRKVSGQFQGDVSEQVRRYLRDTLRSVTNFNEFGLVFVLYDTPQLNNPLVDDYFMLARYDNNMKTDNIGWYYDEHEQNWRPVGNLSMSLTEIV